MEPAARTPSTWSQGRMKAAGNPIGPRGFGKLPYVFYGPHFTDEKTGSSS